MNQIRHLVAAAGGLLHRRDLVAAGARDRHLSAAVRDRHVRRPRRGWYSTWPPGDPRFVAVQVGGRLTGLAALEVHFPGSPWTAGGNRQAPPLIVSVPRNAARLRHRPGVRVVYDRPEVQQRGSAWSVDPSDALARAVLEAPFEDAVALLDWAMYSGNLTRRAVLDAIRSLPADARRVLDWADPRCDSYPESIARTRLRLAGHDVRPQLPLSSGERIDLVVDGAVALEIDGAAFHAERFERDRRKDLRAVLAGLVPLRVSARMVRDLWATVAEAVARSVPRARRAAVRAWVRSLRPSRSRHRSWALLRGRRAPSPTW